MIGPMEMTIMFSFYSSIKNSQDLYR